MAGKPPRRWPTAGRTGGIDIVVNATGFPRSGENAGTIIPCRVSPWFCPLLDAQFTIAKAVVPWMGGEREGVIITTIPPSATMAIHGHLGHIVGCAAMEAFIKALASELGAKNIRVLGVRSHAIADAVLAGSYTAEVFAPKAQALGLSVEQWLGGAAHGTMLQRLPTLAQIAGVITFLASPSAAAMTATVVNVTAGQRLASAILPASRPTIRRMAAFDSGALSVTKCSVIPSINASSPRAVAGSNHCSSVCWLRSIQLCMTAFSAGRLLQNAYSWYINSILRAVVTGAEDKFGDSVAGLLAAPYAVEELLILRRHFDGEVTKRFLNQRLNTAKIIGQRAQRYPGAAGDFTVRHRVNTVRGDGIQRRLQDALAPLRIVRSAGHRCVFPLCALCRSSDSGMCTNVHNLATVVCNSSFSGVYG